MGMCMVGMCGRYICGGHVWWVCVMGMCDKDHLFSLVRLTSDLYTVACANPLSNEALLRIMASSMS